MRTSLSSPALHYYHLHFRSHVYIIYNALSSARQHLSRNITNEKITRRGSLSLSWNWRQSSSPFVGDPRPAEMAPDTTLGAALRSQSKAKGYIRLRAASRQDNGGKISANFPASSSEERERYADTSSLDCSAISQVYVSGLKQPFRVLRSSWLISRDFGKDTPVCLGFLMDVHSEKKIVSGAPDSVSFTAILLILRLKSQISRSLFCTITFQGRVHLRSEYWGPTRTNVKIHFVIHPSRCRSSRTTPITGLIIIIIPYKNQIRITNSLSPSNKAVKGTTTCPKRLVERSRRANFGRQPEINRSISASARILLAIFDGSNLSKLHYAPELAGTVRARETHT